MSGAAIPWSSPAGFSEVRPRRSLGLLLAGALGGLSLAGYSLITAADTAPKTVPAGAVATVNGRPILERDFTAQAEMQFGKPFRQIAAADRRAVLDSMIREELLVQRGLEIEVSRTDPDVRQSIVNAVNLVMAAEVEAAQPSDAEIRGYFARHRENYVIVGSPPSQRYLSFEQARDRVEHELKQDALDQAEEEQLRELRRKAAILVAREYRP